MVAFNVVARTADHVDYRQGGAVQRLLYSTIPGNAWNGARIDRLRQAIQDLIDVRILRADLPPEDEDIDFDPGRLDMFWEGNQVVSRSDIVTVFLDAAGIPNFTITSTRPNG